VGSSPSIPTKQKATIGWFFCLACVQRGSKGGKAKRPVDGLPAPGSAAERLRRATRNQPAGEAESPSIPTKKT